VTEHNTGQPSPFDTTVTRSRFLKGAATTAAAATGAGMLASLSGSDLAHAAITNEAPFNVVGRAPVTVNLVIWSQFPTKTFPKLIQKFEARQPKIKVNMTVIPGTSWAAFFEAILARIAGGSPPDIALIAIEGIALFGSKNLALPIDDFMKKDAAYIEELKSDTVPAFWKALAYKGHQIALPFSYNNMLVWYNPAFLSRPKDNWTGDDFLAMCAKLKKQGRYGTSLWPNGLFGLEAWSLAAGANLLNDDWTRSTATDRGNLVAWEFMHDLVWKYKYAPRPGRIPETPFFESRRLGTFLAGRWPLHTLLLDKFCTRSSCSADVQFFPILEGGPRKTIFGVDGYPIFKSSKNPEAAWQLAKFMSSKEAMYAWTVQGTNIPTRKSLAYATWMSPPAHYRDFYDTMLAATAPVTAPPQYNEVDTAVTKWYSKMMANQVSPKSALAGLDRDITAILKKPA
jgi:multiple sugar transport system substrate-binding protein